MLRLLGFAVFTVCAGVGAVTNVTPSSYRLVVGDGGYTRLMSASPSFSDLTLSAWVNVTTFPDGVAPILTVVAPDASHQVAFFLRHDGLGVLWGGPPSVPRYHLDQVDRHPRTQWAPAEPESLHRVRRDAVDYSTGLGDIVDILADSRKGRSQDTWTPYTFVDVDQMGVADLEASPSGLGAGLHLLPVRGGLSRSESYNDWTNVPYELTMQESDPYDHHLAEPEPRIITEPSGDDDFVFFNWNVPAAPKHSIPQSPNEWSPIWQQKKETHEDTTKPKATMENIPVKDLVSENSNPGNLGSWTSQVTEVKLSPNSWTPNFVKDPSLTMTQESQQPPPTVTLAGPQAAIRKVTTRPSQPTTPHPNSKRTPNFSIVTTQRPVPTRKPTTTEYTTTFTRRPSTTTSTTTSQPSTSATVTTRRPTTTTASLPITILPLNNKRFTASRFTAPPTTTVPKSRTRVASFTRSPAPSRRTTRLPLWKLIKGPNASRHSLSTSTTLKTTTTTTTTTTTSTPTTFRTTRAPPRVHTTRITTTKPTTKQPRPVPTVYFTQQEQVTDMPQITGQKSKVSIWSTAEDDNKSNKGQNYQDKWSSKPAETQNVGNKHRSVSITPHHMDEFHRVMQGVPPIKDGDTAIVYSIPISDPEAFNAMYQYYQAQEAGKFSKSKQATDGHSSNVNTHEEETNENYLGGNNLPAQDNRFSIHYSIKPEASFQETIAPVVLKEEDAVLVPTEDPLPPTPSRSDIPIEEDTSEISTHRKVTAIKTEKTQTPSYVKPLETVTEQQNQHTESAVMKEIPQAVQSPTSFQATHDTLYFNLPSTKESSSDEKSKKIPNLLQPDTNAEATIPFNVKSNPIAAMPESLSQHDIPAPSNVFLSPEHFPFVLPSNLSLIQKPVIRNSVQKHSDTPKASASSDLPLLPKISNIPTALQQGESTKNPKANVRESSDFSLIAEPEVNTKDVPEQHTPSFDIFQIDEDDIPYYPPKGDDAYDFSLDEFYQPAGVLVSQESAHPVSHYQESSHLFHEQLPPQYISPKDIPRPITYGGALHQSASPHQDQDKLEDIVFNAASQKLTDQGLLPHPVHYINTQEAAKQWVHEQQTEPQIEDRIFTEESNHNQNTVPQVTEKNKEGNKANFHFKILPFDLRTNQWYHIVFTWSSKDHEAAIYINGELSGTLTNVLPNEITFPGGGLTIMGQTLLPDLTDFDPTSQFVGEISEVNIWGEKLSAESIHKVYHCTKVETSPVLDWHQITMRFYNDVKVKQDDAICGV